MFSRIDVLKSRKSCSMHVSMLGSSLPIVPTYIVMAYVVMAWQLAAIVPTGWPSSVMLPESGSSNVRMRWSRVDLPK